MSQLKFDEQQPCFGCRQYLNKHTDFEPGHEKCKFCEARAREGRCDRVIRGCVCHWEVRIDVGSDKIANDETIALCGRFPKYSKNFRELCNHCNREAEESR
jgi:hypothetical protein